MTSFLVGTQSSRRRSISVPVLHNESIPHDCIQDVLAGTLSDDALDAWAKLHALEEQAPQSAAGART